MGRKKKTAEQAADEAARVLRVAVLLKQGRDAALHTEGLASRRQARHFLMKRRRGMVADYIGDALVELGVVLKPNKLQASIRLVLEHGMSISAAARHMQQDRRTLQRKIGEARAALPNFSHDRTSKAVRTSS